MAKRHRSYQDHRATRAKRHGHLIPPKRIVESKPVPNWLRGIRSSDVFGQDTEHRAVEAFATGECPSWVLGIRPASAKEDRPGGFVDGVAGVDLWFSTDRGEIPVQIKSSAERAAEFRRTHPTGIAIVVLHRDMTDECIRGRVLAAVERVYSERAMRRAA